MKHLPFVSTWYLSFSLQVTVIFAALYQLASGNPHLRFHLQIKTSRKSIKLIVFWCAPSAISLEDSPICLWKRPSYRSKVKLLISTLTTVVEGGSPWRSDAVTVMHKHRRLFIIWHYTVNVALTYDSPVITLMKQDPVLQLGILKKKTKKQLAGLSETSGNLFETDWTKPRCHPPQLYVSQSFLFMSHHNRF